jgi:hypothetical protein
MHAVDTDTSTRHASAAAVCIYPDGSRFEGGFRQDKRDGHGCLYFPDGSRLVGNFKDDEANGDGILYFKNGDKYEGSFKVRAAQQWKDSNLAREYILMLHIDGRPGARRERSRQGLSCLAILPGSGHPSNCYFIVGLLGYPLIRQGVIPLT